MPLKSDDISKMRSVHFEISKMPFRLKILLLLWSMETNLRIEVGAMFPNKKELKIACQTFTTHKNFEYIIVKFDKSCMIIKCIGEEYLNAVIDEARGKSILAMFEYICHHTMK